MTKPEPAGQLAPATLVAAALANYQPRSLEAAAWAAARDAVAAAVAACRPGSTQDAQTLASVACRVLGAQHRWDRRAAPDLTGCLTPAEVDRLTGLWLTQGLSLSLCYQLRRLAAGAQPGPAQGRRGRRASPAPGRVAGWFFAAMAGAGPVTTVVACYHRCGATFHGLSRQGLDLPAHAPDLRILFPGTPCDGTNPAAAPVGVPGTVMDARTAGGCQLVCV